MGVLSWTSRARGIRTVRSWSYQFPGSERKEETEEEWEQCREVVGFLLNKQDRLQVDKAPYRNTLIQVYDKVSCKA